MPICSSCLGLTGAQLFSAIAQGTYLSRWSWERNIDFGGRREPLLNRAASFRGEGGGRFDLATKICKMCSVGRCSMSYSAWAFQKLWVL